MTLVVTGATGQLGRHVITELLARGVPAGQIVAAVRQPEKAADLAAQGVQVRQADYTKPDTLRTAFAGATKILLISSSEVGQRAAQHANVIAAAKEAGAGLLAYTSIARADSSTLQLAAEHQATEQLVRDSGLPFVLLRNGWYTENYTGQLAVHLEHGIVGSAGDGRVSAATRADYAAAAAVVLATDGHEGQVYELGGDTAFTMAEYAAALSAASGKAVTYTDLPVEAYTQVLEGAGLPAPVASVLADADAGVARGELHVTSGDLARLAGRPTTPLDEAIKQALTA
ncbi:MAG: NAD(P)-dependent oxidoreductase [Frankiales bacterium]|nr:NAD(P)-dependent oxidoreductase [Frankiales bacterium]